MKNSAIPEANWQDNRNGGKRPPWHFCWGGYLVDPQDAALYTYINSTSGAKVAVNMIKSQFERMNALRGQQLGAVVELHDRVVSKQFNKKGPLFVVIGWVELTNAPAWLGSAPAAPQLLIEAHEEEDAYKSTNKRGVQRTHLRQTRKPSWNEILDDDLPDDLK